MEEQPTVKLQKKYAHPHREKKDATKYDPIYVPEYKAVYTVDGITHHSEFVPDIIRYFLYKAMECGSDEVLVKRFLKKDRSILVQLGAESYFNHFFKKYHNILRSKLKYLIAPKDELKIEAYKKYKENLDKEYFVVNLIIESLGWSE